MKKTHDQYEKSQPGYKHIVLTSTDSMSYMATLAVTKILLQLENTAGKYHINPYRISLFFQVRIKFKEIHHEKDNYLLDRSRRSGNSKCPRSGYNRHEDPPYGVIVHRTDRNANTRQITQLQSTIPSFSPPSAGFFCH